VSYGSGGRSEEGEMIADELQRIEGTGDFARVQEWAIRLYGYATRKQEYVFALELRRILEQKEWDDERKLRNVRWLVDLFLGHVVREKKAKIPAVGRYQESNS
jgi:hypothetical protein